MADYDFEPPSFSLGLDFDTEPSPVPDPLLQPAKPPSTPANPHTIEEEEHDDGDFESPTRVPDPPRALKRLRRGSTIRTATESEKRELELVDEGFNVTEEIEDFSSEEDRPRGVLPANFLCSSSKPSLHGQRFVTTESRSHSKSIKGKEQVSSASEKKDSNAIFPKLTPSPLRRFHLIDSDSDEPSINVDHGNKVPRAIGRASAGNQESDDLWKDFDSKKKSFRIPTPAFDEVIEEYFTNAKNKSKVESEHNMDRYTSTQWDDKATLSPAHFYFFHRDSRIQKLVRERLPFFSPLGAVNNEEHKQQNVSVIDYMGQFGNEDTRQKEQGRNIEKKRSRGNKIIVNNSQVESTSRASSEWVNPRSYAGAQKNAGSRRVQAVSKSGGHWFTGSDGNRVYVNKMGHELSGQLAYRHYRKESGKDFKKSKKKTVVKKKNASNKKYVAKKK